MTRSILVRGLVALGLVALFTLATSCSGAAYLGHSASGHLSLMRKRQPIEAMLGDERISPELRQSLARAAEIREFASTELRLPDNGSYRTYVEIDRPYVVWNVVAAPALSLDPVRWCFPFTGCVSYRGYFSQERAEKFAGRLAGEGYDTSVGGVVAYSTLGWFKDPILSTFVEYPEVRLAGLIFHELTHQRLFVKGDTVFNESLATAVELEGVRRWIASETGPTEGAPTADEARRDAERRARQADFNDLLRRHRGQLEEVYSGDGSEEEKLGRKVEIFRDLELAYEALRDSEWDGFRGYDGWFSRDLNNADLISVGSYHDYVPGFVHLLEQAGGDLERFFQSVSVLARMSAEERRSRLAVDGD